MIRIAFFALIALSTSEALAFVPTMTCNPSGTYRCRPGETAKQVRWKERCVSYYVNEQGSLDISGAAEVTSELETAINESFDSWHNAECSDLQILYGGTTDDARTAADGKANVLVWRDQTWPTSYSRTAFALTSVTYNTETGHIVDADIEMNGEFHTFTVGDENVLIDVQNTLTHEAGHFIGLDHPVPNLDDDDMPRWTAVDLAATMFEAASSGETKKRTLEQDDIDGICSIYPVLDGGRSCTAPPPHSVESSRDDEGCCSTVPTGRSSPPLSLFVMFAFLVMIRRVSQRG